MGYVDIDQGKEMRLGKPEEPNSRISRVVDLMRGNLKRVQKAPRHNDRKRRGKDFFWKENICPQVELIPHQVKSEIDKRAAIDLLVRLRNLVAEPLSDPRFGSAFMPSETMQEVVLSVLSKTEVVIEQIETNECLNCGKCGRISEFLRVPENEVIDPAIMGAIQANKDSEKKLKSFTELIHGTRKFSLEMGQKMYELVKDMHISETESAVISLLRRRNKENSPIVDGLLAFVFKEKADKPLKRQLVESLRDKFKKNKLRGEGKSTIAAALSGHKIGEGFANEELKPWMGKPIPLEFPIQEQPNNNSTSDHT